MYCSTRQQKQEETTAMALYCSRCGKQHPDDAKFCMECGNPFQSASVAWEYKDVTIPLNVRAHYIKQGSTPEVAGDPYSEIAMIILRQLHREWQEGWEPEGSTDFTVLQRLGRVDSFRKAHWSDGETEYCDYRSVTIRFKRPSPQ
jgi:zinc ribbon protein